MLEFQHPRWEIALKYSSDSNQSQCRLFFVSRAQQVHIEPNGTRHSGRQLPEEGISRIDIGSLAVLGAKQAAFLFLLTRIMAREQRGEMAVPFIHEIEATLLNPAIKIV